MLILITLMSDASLSIIAICGAAVGTHSLETLMMRYYGKFGGYSVTYALALLLFLADVTILIASSDQWSDIFSKSRVRLPTSQLHCSYYTPRNSLLHLTFALVNKMSHQHIQH